MTSATPFRVLVAGGGPAAIEAVLTLRDLASELEVTLLAPDHEYLYRPLSTIAPFAHGEVRSYDLNAFEGFGVTVVHDALRSVEPDDRVVVTETGQRLTYDALLVATGARLRRDVPRVMTFEGPGYVEAMHGLILDVEDGYTRSVAFVAPPGVSWTLPLYELALQTAERAYSMGMKVDFTLVTHEARPLEAFGGAASDLVARLLLQAGIEFRTGTDLPKADRTVALPVQIGRRTPGLPHDADDFVPVDEHGRVAGVPHVWAAGDGTDNAIKQGGLATQQAESAARSIAIAAGAPISPRAYRPELRAMIYSGSGAWFLRRPYGDDQPSEVSQTPLWDPPTKIAGYRLGPFLDALDATTPRANRFERRLTEHSG